MGKHFVFHGQVYKKVALSMAEDVNENGSIFMACAPVEPCGTGGPDTGTGVIAVDRAE